MASSAGPSYPDRFYLAAKYASIPGTCEGAEDRVQPPPLRDDSKLVLYALYQQATIGPCNAPKPWSWNVVESAKWTSWNALGRTAPVEAMRLFVRTLEEEEPDWFAKATEGGITLNVANGAPDSSPKAPGPEAAVPQQKAPAAPAPATTAKEAANGATPVVASKPEVKEPEVTRVESFRSISKFDQWISPFVSGRRPPPRYQHEVAVVGDQLFVVGGNSGGRYLNDLWVLSLENFTWSRVEQIGPAPPSKEEDAPLLAPPPLPPLAGHSIIASGSTLLAVGGHTKEPAPTVQVRSFDTTTSKWSILETTGDAPAARGGQTVVKAGSRLVLFGGEDRKRKLLNDVHVLDLETKAWDSPSTSGAPPSPRCDHTATLHNGRYMLVFGGGTLANCYNDLHLLDLETFEWSRPETHGDTPHPRSGHASVAIGDTWYIVGGGDNAHGIADTLALNLNSFTWSVAATVPTKTSIASEGLSVVAAYEEGLVAFGGYNGRYSNEIHVFKPTPVEKPKPVMVRSKSAENAAAAVAAKSPSKPAPEKSTDPPKKPSSAAAPPEESPVEATRPSREAAENEKRAKREAEAKSRAEEEARAKAEDERIARVRQEMDGKSKSAIEAAVKAKEKAEAAANAAVAELAKTKQELNALKSKRLDGHQELETARKALASEQQRCFQLEVEVSSLKQQLGNVEALEQEIKLLRRKAEQSEAAAASAKQQQQSGIFSWITGTPQAPSPDEPRS
ncbi:Acyl CoA Binding Protein [Klebsormidium nitens]|uniref:Acyl CoA Binding Protein n=1 Tax=Klebsormidium nitens TaxID=105231 RepID=A0A1Y1HMZ9_KLENI|nr:Acyl CoA Binding Protein [Klebsormidium nitens]|eukprot:GAQ79092.1 Acyl CoA Binding Protein [Klebsormidium nitens]